MILHPVIFWTLFGCILIFVLYPLLLLFALWCESFKFSVREYILSYGKDIFLLTIPLSVIPLLICIFCLNDLFPQMYIIDDQNNVKHQYFIFHNTDTNLTPEWESFYVKNESKDTVYEYKQEYSNHFQFSTDTGIVSKILPGKASKLSRKPTSLMKGIPDKFVVRYRNYFPLTDVETFVISQKQYESIR